MANRSGKRAGAKLSIVLLSVFLFLLLFSPVAFAATYGDINDDGVINVQDVVLVMKHVLELEELTATQQVVADVNGDGKINVQDVTLIMQYSLGLIDEFPDSELTVMDVKASNLREIEITFSRILTAEQKLEVVKFANIQVFKQADLSTDIFTSGNNAVVTILDDQKTVRVTLKDNNMLANYTTANKVVVKKAVGLSADYTKTDLAVSDTTVPTVEGVEVTGPRHLTVTFSEPILASSVTTARFTIDNGAYIVSTAELVALNPRTVEITVGVNLTEGAHSIRVGATAGLVDHAGYAVVPRTISFNVVYDKTAPTATIESATPSEVILVFDKPVNSVNNANVRYRHTFNSATYQKFGNTANFITQLSSTRYSLNFSDMPISPGNNVLYIGYVLDTGTKITDNWGNAFAAATLPMDVQLDSVKPVVTSVEYVNPQTVKVVFNKPVDLATSQTTSNYIVKDAHSVTVAVTSATRGANALANTVTLGFAANAIDQTSYTINIKNVKDMSFIPNTMDEVTIDFTAVDEVRPVPGTNAYFSNTSKKVRITFSEPMKTSGEGSIGDKSNYLYTPDGGTERSLGAADSISVAADGRSVVLTISTATLQAADSVKVMSVRDLANNVLNPVIKEYTGANLIAETVVLEKVEATDLTTIRATFSKPLSSVSATGFKLHEVNDADTGISLALASHNVITIGGVQKSVVTFTLGDSLNHDATYDDPAYGLQLVINGATGTKSLLGEQVADFAAGPAPRNNDVTDKIPPAVEKITYNSATKITIKFKEDLDSATLSATGLNGFSVSGGTLTKAAIGADDDLVELTGTSFTVNTDVMYNAIAGITDVNGNSLASFSWTSTLSP